MRRDTFLKSLAALAAASALPNMAWANTSIKMMIPATARVGRDHHLQGAEALGAGHARHEGLGSEQRSGSRCGIPQCPARCPEWL